MDQPARVCEQCRRCPQIIHFTHVDARKLQEESHLCQECAERDLEARVTAAQSAWPEVAPSQASVNTDAEVEIELERIIISEVHEQQVMAFREVAGPRRFSIMIGIYEATGIDRTVRQLQMPRPLTHDAWLRTIHALDASVHSVCIDQLEAETYYTTLRLTRADARVVVDIRPSDGVAVALKAGAPIFIPEHLLTLVAGPA